MSSDQKPVSAHRLVLSACSDFFKTIFHSNTHSHPLIYLDGVDFSEVNLVLDYIYQGEVQINQEYLDRFLQIASKLKLEGLLASKECEDTFESGTLSESGYDEGKAKADDEKNLELDNDFVKAPKQSKTVKDRSVKVLNESFEAHNSEVEEKFQELIVHEGNKTFRCTVCEKTMSHRASMKRHVETHLSGLSYDCQFCEKTFRSSNALRQHKSIYRH